MGPYRENARIPNDRYWATVDTPEELAAAINAKIDDYFNDVRTAGRDAMWRRAARLYFGYDADGGWNNSAAVSYGGDNGETVLLRVNQFRSLLRSMITLVTGTRPIFNARPKTADTRAQAEAKLAEAILDFYIRDYGLEDETVITTIYALVAGEGWMETKWDIYSGDPYDIVQSIVPGQEEKIAENARLAKQHDTDTGAYIMETYHEQVAGRDPSVVEPPSEPAYHEIETYEQVQRTGDIVFRALHPEDVVRDVNIERPDRAQWLIVRDRKNRWDLVAEFPEHKDAILNATDTGARNALRSHGYRGNRSGSESDYVDVWELWHVRCDALPRGRYALVIEDTVLADTDMPYDALPQQPMIPSLEFKDPYGYGESWDLMAMQQAYDATISTIVSNHAAFGMQNIWTPPGADIDIVDLGGGLKHIKSLQKPEPIQLMPTNGVYLELMSAIEKSMQTLSGINDVTRGEAAASQSGSALAMMASIAVQYNSSLQRAYGQLWEHVGTAIVRIFQRWADIPRVIEVAGKQSIPVIREVSGKDIQQVNSITVDLGNPIMRTSAGKKETADKLLAAKVISAEQYMQVQATGKLDAVYNRPSSQRTLIESENERFMTGQPVKCLITDDHKAHIAEHTVLLNEPSIRYDDAIVQAVDYHIREHVMQWAQASPVILAATDQAPPPMPMMPGMPAPGPGGPGGPPNPGAGTNPPNKGPELGPQMGAGGAMNAGKAPRMPDMPKNPATGERVPPGSAMS